MKSVGVAFLLFLISGFEAAGFNSDDSLSAVPPANKRNFKRIDVFPAISYTPETKLTLGAIGYYYMDLSKGKPGTNLSNINFLAIYTTAKQIAIESKVELFFPGNKWRLRGELFYNHYPDRNYGTGNDASVVLQEFRDDEVNTVNYLSVNTDRIKFTPVILRELQPSFYIGIQTDIEYIYNYKALYDHKYISGDSSLIKDLPADGLRSGIGIQFLFDNRDYILNPIRGHYLETSHLHYGNFTFSDFSFSSIRIDGRTYINPVLNHTIALRMLLDFRYGEGPYSLRGYGRVGGGDFLRGYFQGTYQDKTLLGFEAEYRLPFWRENTDSKLWQVWKRLGIVVFTGAAQVSEAPRDMEIGSFRVAAGGGVRVLFSKESRLNIRIDYAVGLAKNSDGPGKIQKGLYFYLAEAF